MKTQKETLKTKLTFKTFHRETIKFELEKAFQITNTFKRELKFWEQPTKYYQLPIKT